MLTVNVNPVHSLANGSMGDGVAVVAADDKSGLPICVIVDFPEYTGPPLFHIQGDEEGNKRRRKWVAIFPETRAHDDKPWLTRTQLPIKLCYAITINKSQGLSIARPTNIDLNPPTPSSKYKPLRIRGMAFVAATRLTTRENLAFRNLPSYQEFQAAMSTPSFQHRVKHDREMRMAHVRTLKKLFGISPEEEEGLHAAWDAERGNASTWKPPSAKDKELEDASAQTQSKTGRARKHYTHGDCVWYRGQAAVVFALEVRRDEDHYTVVKPLPDGTMQIEAGAKGLRPRRRAPGGSESLWLSLADRQLQSASGHLAAEQSAKEVARLSASSREAEQRRARQTANTEVEACPPPSQAASQARTDAVFLDGEGVQGAASTIVVTPTLGSSSAGNAGCSDAVCSDGEEKQAVALATAATPTLGSSRARSASSSEAMRSRLQYRPLPNLSNTCYMNSAVQVVRAIPPLVQLIATHRQNNDHDTEATGQPCVVCALDDVLACVGTREHCAKKLHALLQSMRGFEQMGAGDVREQHDAGQVLLSLVEEVRRIMHPKSRGIPGIFGGHFTRQRRCVRCNSDWKDEPLDRTDTSWTVQLANRGARASVLDMFEDMTVPEELLVRCEACGGDTVEGALELQAMHERRWPGLRGGWFPTEPYVAVQIRKHTNADFLRMHTFPKALEICANGIQVYAATAALVFLGESQHKGHYIAYAQDVDGQWWRLDDTEVTTTSWDRVANPYIVIYKRVEHRLPQIASSIVVPACETSLQCWSWNVMGLETSDQRIRAIVKALRTASPEFCFLQEVAPRQHVALLDALGGTYQFAAPKQDGAHFCVLAVKKPWRLLDVAWQPLPSCMADRGYITAAIAQGTTILHVLTTHLDAGVDVSDRRSAQLQLVFSEHVDVIIGDLNCRDGEVEAVLRDCRYAWLDAWEACGAPADHRYTWDSVLNSLVPSSFFKRPRFRFDRCYVRADSIFASTSIELAACDKLDVGFASDHFALAVRWQLKKPNSGMEGCGPMQPPSASALKRRRLQ